MAEPDDKLGALALDLLQRATIIRLKEDADELAALVELLLREPERNRKILELLLRS
jgi:hypothetical protein